MRIRDDDSDFGDPPALILDFSRLGSVQASCRFGNVINKRPLEQQEILASRLPKAAFKSLKSSC
jgi:hypothetical protein